MSQRKPKVACGNFDDFVPLTFRGSWTLRVFDAFAMAFALAYSCDPQEHYGPPPDLRFMLMIGCFFTALFLRNTKSMGTETSSLLSTFMFFIFCSLGSLIHQLGGVEAHLLVTGSVFFVSLLMFIHECGLEIIVDEQKIVKRQRLLVPSEICISREEVQEIMICSKEGIADVTIAGSGKQISLTAPRLVKNNSRLQKQAHETWGGALARMFRKPAEDACWADMLAQSLGGEILSRLEREFKRDGYLQMGPLHILADRVIVEVGGGLPITLGSTEIMAVHFNGEKLGLLTESQTVYVKSDFANSAYVGIVLGLKPTAPGVYFRSDDFHCYRCENFPMRFRALQGVRKRVAA
ncbi:MAG: hypothetical protein K2X77_01760 [Candidatus Obscuribacterales bacterium]|nr:hypothetical protein [Candidatus Obscuribacterales bacterium]